MTLRLPRPREASMLAAVGLALLTLLGSVSSPPEVEIDDLSRVGGGETIRVRGLVVDAWMSDSGVFSLVLAELGEGATLKVVCSPGLVQKSIDVHVGDMVLVVGELEQTGGRPVLWGSCDDIQLVQPSRDALTLGAVAGAWDLLIGDRFEVAGFLVESGDGTFRLTDLDRSVSIALQSADIDAARFADRKVVLDATLRLQQQTMELVLQVHAISLS